MHKWQDKNSSYKNLYISKSFLKQDQLTTKQFYVWITAKLKNFFSCSPTPLWHSVSLLLVPLVLQAQAQARREPASCPPLALARTWPWSGSEQTGWDVQTLTQFSGRNPGRIWWRWTTWCHWKEHSTFLKFMFTSFSDFSDLFYVDNDDQCLVCQNLSSFLNSQWRRIINLHLKFNSLMQNTNSGFKA